MRRPGASLPRLQNRDNDSGNFEKLFQGLKEVGREL